MDKVNYKPLVCWVLADLYSWVTSCVLPRPRAVSSSLYVLQWHDKYRTMASCILYIHQYHDREVEGHGKRDLGQRLAVAGNNDNTPFARVVQGSYVSG